MGLRRALRNPQGRGTAVFVQTVEISHQSPSTKHLSRLRPWRRLGDTSRIIGTAAHIANNRSLLYHCDGCDLKVHVIVYTEIIGSLVIEHDHLQNQGILRKKTAHGSTYMTKPGLPRGMGREASKQPSKGREPKANSDADKRKHWKCQLETSDSDSQ